LADYPDLSAEELRIVLVHSRDRVLPELSESLARYAMGRMRERGVTFRLNARVSGAGPGWVTLSTAECIPTETLVWTAGAAPSPVVRDLPVDHDARGAACVEPTLGLRGHTNVWALGDCASVPDTEAGGTCPPTAQVAVKQAALLAHNLRASLRGRPLKPFRFKSLGSLCVVGHHIACAQIGTLKFSGLFAWLLWRGVYLGKLPGLERKIRVLTDWTLELFFPRDVVQTLELDDAGLRQSRVTLP
ncbi:MAG: FAD-dependent oxidoreductase, partial [Verrucomicrobia bacterium]|nr:FAD-dependent oxidoreductase [Verrucomicrobiota bacterium]